MIFPANIVGPQFCNGDLLIFSFDGAELTLSAPKVPNNPRNIDDVSPIKDFRGINTDDWKTDDQNHHTLQLLLQHWDFEDARTLDDIARLRLYVELVEVAELERSKNTLLSFDTFEQLMLSWHSHTFKNHEEKYLENPNWPALANRYHGRSIVRKDIDWFVVQVALNSRSKPTQMLMLPINNRFALIAFIKIESLHYPGRTNPHSDELLKQFEADLFEDFLSHIKIEYSPEIIATIQSLKDKTPA